MIETNSKSKSQFVGYFGVKDSKKIQDDLILPMVNKFFAARNIQTFKSIQNDAAISDLDFDRKNFDDFFAHFYEFIVDGIHKNGNNVEIPVTYCITLDEINCSKICAQTQIRYDEILLFDTPVFYFIFVEVKDVFSCLRGENVAVVELPEIELPKLASKFTVKNGIATHDETGLQWQRFALGQSWNQRTTGTAKTLTWEQAISEARKDNYAGHHDWRIPTIEELKTLIEASADIFPMTNQKVTKFWSSTTNANNHDAQIVDFSNGSYPPNSKTNKNHVRLVRGGQ